jgi:hypothetical protein
LISSSFAMISPFVYVSDRRAGAHVLHGAVPACPSSKTY